MISKRDESVRLMPSEIAETRESGSLSTRPSRSSTIVFVTLAAFVALATSAVPREARAQSLFGKCDQICLQKKAQKQAEKQAEDAAKQLRKQQEQQAKWAEKARKQAEKDAKRQAKEAARYGYPAPQQQYQPQYQQPQYQPQYQQPQTQYGPPNPNGDQSQQTWEAQRRAQQQAWENQQRQAAEQQADYYRRQQQQSQYPNQYYQRSDDGSRQRYGDFTNLDWTQYQSNYNFVPTPVMGAAYDKTPYPVTVNEPELKNIIQSALATHSEMRIGEATVDVELVKKFYSLRGYQPAFITSQGPTPQAQKAKDLFQNQSILKGLDARDYWFRDMESRFNQADTPFKKAGLDLLLAQSYIRLASDLSNGRAKTGLVDSYVMIKKRVFTDFQALSNTLRDGIDQQAAFDSFEPQHPDYLKLQQALVSLYKIKAQGGWPKIPDGQVLKPGMASPTIPLIRSRLMELNIIPFSDYVDSSTVYDQTFAQAIREFQWSHRLVPSADGSIGKQTFAVLNTPVEERIKEVRATLEKWRWMPRNLGNRYILVNIARQEMQVFENGQVVMSMKTVNGQLLRPTNILNDKVINVALNPYWNPPPSLILQDIMPKQRADANHMSEEHVKIYSLKDGQEIDPATVNWNEFINKVPPFKFREEPGIKNSLGVVKFQTTNPSAIYLHDTNHREFFTDFNERYLSSGCIRLEKPLDLLQYLLRNKPEWTPQKLDEYLSHPNQYTDTVVDLGADAIPFYVFYGTASFDDTGKLRFARDAYKLDERILRAITPQEVSL